jgi:NAD(P)-dependent dehydrogenase (short-subunit alcohol dehydrogenase family)
VIVFKKLDDLSEAEIRRIIDINLVGTMIGAQAAIPALERAGGGSITNMSSADGIAGRWRWSSGRAASASIRSTPAASSPRSPTPAIIRANWLIRRTKSILPSAQAIPMTLVPPPPTSPLTTHAIAWAPNCLSMAAWWPAIIMRACLALRLRCREGNPRPTRP